MSKIHRVLIQTGRDLMRLTTILLVTLMVFVSCRTSTVYASECYAYHTKMRHVGLDIYRVGKLQLRMS